jgi:hypothetical protein
MIVAAVMLFSMVSDAGGRDLESNTYVVTTSN